MFNLEADGDYNARDIVKEMNPDIFYPFKRLIQNMLKDEDTNYNFSLELESDDETKWYDHERDMLTLSVQFPNVLFKLHGEGEENDDVWDHYFKNGKSQYCKVKFIIPPFDENELK